MNKEQNKIDILKDVIRSIEQQIKNLEAESNKPKKWNPVGGDWYIDSTGTVLCMSSTIECCIFGHERSSEELAIRAGAEMRQFNRLLAYRDEFVPSVDEHCDWYVTYHKVDQTWEAYRLYSDNSHHGRVLFPHQVAIDLVKKLNSGEVEL
jgi:hypothetical protein